MFACWFVDLFVCVCWLLFWDVCCCAVETYNEVLNYLFKNKVWFVCSFVCLFVCLFVVCLFVLVGCYIWLVACAFMLVVGVVVVCGHCFRRLKFNGF